jgi:hypothetical protein
MPYNFHQITYRERLTPWAIAQLLPNMQRTIVGRFRSRSDADGHLRCLRQLIPHASFVVMFDPQPDEETLPVSLATAKKAVI